MTATRGRRRCASGTQGRPGRAGTALAGAAVLAGAALLAGCGSVHAGATGPRPGHRSTGPAAGSRAEALAQARHLLSRLALPPGVRPLRARPLPRALRQPETFLASANGIDQHAVYAVSQGMLATERFLMAHFPAGTRVSGHGQAGSPGATTSETVTYTPRTFPSGIYQLELDVAVAPAAHGGSLVRADAQAIWYPPRSAAEHINPAAFHAVTVTANLLNRSPHTTTRMFTSRRVIAQLAGLLNGLHAAPPLMISCPAMMGSFRVAFAASPGKAPGVVATAAGCLTDHVTVGGVAQPALLDQGARLAAAAQHLLGVRLR